MNDRRAGRQRCVRFAADCESAAPFAGYSVLTGLTVCVSAGS